MSKERIVFACYKPHPGKEKQLKELISTHIDILLMEDLASSRTPLILQSEHGSIIEIFGWKSKEAIDEAHQNSNVQKLWEEFSKVCTFIPPSEIPEIHNVFSEFTPLEL